MLDDGDEELRRKFWQIVADLGIGKDRLGFCDPGLRAAASNGMEIPEEALNLNGSLKQRSL